MMLKEFQEIGKRLFAEGLISSYAGSLSIKLNDKIIITAKGTVLAELKEEDLIEVPFEGNFDERASIDMPLHRAIYSSTDARAIVHAHPAYGVAISLNEEKIIPQDLDGKYILKGIPVIRVRDMSSLDEVIKFLVPALKSGYPACLVRSHGSYAIGADLTEAFKLTSMLEFSCKINVIAKSQNNHDARKDDKPRGRTQPQYRSAIPPSIGVMDRTYRDRTKR